MNAGMWAPTVPLEVPDVGRRPVAGQREARTGGRPALFGASEQALVSKIEPAIVDLIRAGQGEGDVRELNPVSAARLIEAMFDAVTFPDLAVDPVEIVEFTLVALLSDPARLPEIRSAADALEISAEPAHPLR
ncbi:hypothetical protein LAUMK142_00143 [Mycobacterium pseudokansasii]|uniref:Uncharacterized protein n=1 Tax=Mycobacterium pseudokansasii TaxID=2341080 RepID=A0A498QKU5_9MYCO|nr:hypothetical protein [Mycobacterium pseudokansasii]VBA45874.1 hypothetical protein LAUMK142_00143 [Mycobacterium pseudokansasii]